MHAWNRWNTWAPIRWWRRAWASKPFWYGCRAARASTPATRSASPGMKNTSIASMLKPEEENHESDVEELCRRVRMRRDGVVRAGDHVLLPGRRGRPDHQDHRPDGGRLRTREPGHQGE